MFYPFSKHFLPYYVGLVFIVFPILGLRYFGYPLWTLPITLLFLIAYLALIHLKQGYGKVREILWLYVLLYITYMSCFINGNMMWFFFYPSNLLVWKFDNSWRSYRGISLLIMIGLVSIFGILSTNSVADKIAIMLILLFILGMTVFMVQTREEDRLKNQLYQKSQENSILITENERNRIGRDLHDTLGHTFAMMTLKTELALKQLDKENLTAVQKELEGLHHISKNSMKDVRQLINNLKYRTVTEELETIGDMFALANIEFQIEKTIHTDQLSPVIQSSINMILRELTTNIIKHAKARTCHIKLEGTKEIVIEVTDDGQGFPALTGHELHSIKERLHLVKGRVEILSSQNPTRIRMTLEEGEKS
ncbi:two-component system sensor histidine kinase [Streptococcus varani]|uniref:histidine kinase n=1 Tax=Streptococcus varani TaxID=1608583 RepID=A0A0E3WF21_9STRE|nr:sensor histidine kinase [Streptococcus varani]CQR24720.1 two-component system sensor histidine kinase [Streptococcus varani]